MQNMWITVDRALLSEILSLYRIGRPVQGYSLITNLQYTEGDGITPRVKIIAKVDVGGGESLIIKLVKEKEHPAAVMEEQSMFSQALWRSGIFVPERFADPSGGFCIVEPLTENDCSVTVERGVAGEELKAINAYYMRTLAEMMANMHLVSLQNNCQIRLNTIWNLYDLQADLQQ